jgi:hypothetical protein
MFDWFGNWNNVLGALVIAPLAVGGVVNIIEALRRPKEPTENDVQRTADRYREFYRDRALVVIGDHMLAATFSPCQQHHAFLKRVCEELRRGPQDFP